MPTTSPDGLRYPVLGVAPNVPLDVKALADDVQAKVAAMDADLLDVLARLLNMESEPVATLQTTASASYVDLATAGPSVTIDSTAGFAVALWTANTWCDVVTAGSAMSVAVTGATTIAAADTAALKSGGLGPSSGFGLRACQFKLFPVNAGTNIYTCKYKAVGGTATFRDRELFVWAP